MGLKEQVRVRGLVGLGDTLGHSSVDGRPRIVRRVEQEDGRVAIDVSKEGRTGSPRHVGHHVTTPPTVR